MTEKNVLRIAVPAGVKLALYTGFQEGKEIKPSRTELGRKGTTYVFSDLPVGDYRYTASGEGRFTRTKAFFFSEDKAAAGVSLTFDPLKKTGLFYEPCDEIINYNDEVLEKVIPSDRNLWEAYADVFVTPGLDPAREPDRVTTHQELLAFLRKTVTPESNGYLFTLGKTEGYGLPIPAAIFTKTDLRGVKTVEEAAKKMKQNRRLTVHYQAQIHGNEPGAGEGALAVIAALAGKRGKAWLEKMDIYVIPRVNPDGARAYTRNEVAKNINLNRDFILCEAVETRAIQHMFQLFRPEIFIDGHEYTKKPNLKTAPFDDLMLGVAAGVNNGKAVNELSLDLLKEAFAGAGRAKMRVTTYTDAQYLTKLCIANAINPSTGRLYYGLLGTLTLLIETRGNTAGKEAFLRRVAGQVVAVTTALDFAAAQAERIVRTVRAEREAIRESGTRFDPNRKFILTTDISKNENTALKVPRPLFDLETGDCIRPDNMNKLYFYDVALRSRPFPTAYVLPRGYEWEALAENILVQNGIVYDTLPAGANIPLRQYIGSARRAFLNEESEVSFPRGAIVIPMAQEAGLLAATLLEPDCTDADEGRGSLAQSGVITATAGVFPIYRYVRDLPRGKSPASKG